MNLDYRVLGPIEVWADGSRLDIGGARQQRLLGALVLADGRPLSAERLVDVVWVGSPPSRARNTLRTYVARARRALETDGDSPLITDQNGWRLERSAGDLDGARFEALLASARAMSADPMAALATLDEALSMWRDVAFVDFSDEDWCAGEAVRLDELRTAAEEERFEAMLGCGMYDDAIGELERFTDRHPLRDRPRAQHMVALYRAGRQVDAVRTFQAYQRYLRDEIGVEASEELRSLEQRIIVRDPSLQQLAPSGRQLRGYRLGPMIGQGTFGRIYRAAQPMLGREVAIKVVRPELADDPDFIRRFDAEARIVARLEHPHIVPLFDYWREPGGAYLVMRYLKGGNARQLVNSHDSVPIERVARVVDDIGSALATAHASGVVHRDVKPENILFDELGNAYLGDFGIAVAGAHIDRDDPLPSWDVLYTSPEHVDEDATPSSDVYSFGVVLYELLAGHTPIPADTPFPKLVERKRRGELPDIRVHRSDLPRAVNDVIRCATEPDPSQRFSTAADLVMAFRSATEYAEIVPVRSLGWPARNPYKGLAAFDEADERDFFGRHRLVEQLHEATMRSRFVAVVGPSGSGKSSVVRAGLAPLLRNRGCYVVAMTPGSQPIEELDRALLRIAPAASSGAIGEPLDEDTGLRVAVERCIPDDTSELVLIIDQFEELFTMADAAGRTRFLRTIAATARDPESRLRVVATIRADFFDLPLGDGSIGELVQANTILVPPLGTAELTRAISAPAERVGVGVEPALVAALTAEAASATAALPLVQYELTTLFDERDDETLTLAAYNRHGGLGGAIARRADDIFERYDDDRDDVRRLFGRLVSPGDRGDDTRRRVRVSELVAVPSEVVNAYADARLLTVDRDPVTREPTLELAHEALIDEWPRLREWVDADREGLRTLRHLTAAANAWEASGRDPGELYRGGRLGVAEEWAATHGDDLNPGERDFLEASVRARDEERTRERRHVRRLRLLVTGFGVATVIAVIAGTVALWQRQVADENAAEAERRALENRTSRLVTESALARVESDPDLSILLAIAAHDVSKDISDTPQPGVVAALHEAVQSSRLERRIAAGYAEIAVSPDGRTVALDHEAERNRLATYDIETGVALEERTLDSNVGGLAYSPDGSLLAASFCCTEAERAEDRAAMLLLDPSSLEIVHTLDGGVESGFPSWSSDGERVLSVGWTGVRVWTVGEPEAEWTLDGTDNDSRATFVPGSSEVAVTADGVLKIIDLDTGDTRVRHEIPLRTTGVHISAAGDQVALIDGATEVVEVRDLVSGDIVERIEFPSPRDVRFSPDGGSLSVAGNADFVRVVSLESSDAVDLRGHGTGAWRQAYAPNGRLLVPTLDGGTRVWNLRPEGPSSLGNLTIDGFARVGQTYSNSSLLASVETDGEMGHVDLIDIASNTSRTVADFWFGQFRWPVFSPDGALVAGFSPDDRLATVIDVDTGDQVLILRPCDTPKVVDNANRWVLIDAWCLNETESPLEHGSQTGFFDLATGDLLSDAGADAVFAAAIGPSGSVGADVVAYTTQDDVVFRRASTLEVLSRWEIPDDVITLVVDFSPDGSAVGISAQSRQGIVFDVPAILNGTTADNAVTVMDEMHDGPVHRAIPVGDSLVTTGSQSEVRQWDVATETLEVDVSTAPRDFVNLFALPDGETLFYSDRNGVLRRYLTDPDALAALARSRVQREFTETECLRYFPAEECPR